MKCLQVRESLAPLPRRLLPFLSALRGPSLRSAGLRPSRCGVKAACPGAPATAAAAAETAPAVAVADLAPGQRPRPQGERGRRKGRRRGRRRRRGAVSRPEEAGLPGVGVVNSPEREKDREERRETHQCHAGGDPGGPSPRRPPRRQHLWDRGRRLSRLSRFSRPSLGTSEAAPELRQGGGSSFFSGQQTFCGDALRGGEVQPRSQRSRQPLIAACAPPAPPQAAGAKEALGKDSPTP